MNRRGVVLLITIGFITAIMAVIGYQFTIVDRGFKRTAQETFYYQSSLLLHDIQKTLLPNVLKEVLNQCGSGASKSECFEGFLSMSYDIPTPLINDPTIGTVVITLLPPATGFDPDGLKKLTPEERDFFRVFTQELIYPDLLMELMDLALETNSSVNSSYEYLKADEDIPINDIFFRKGTIVDREQFDVILNAYYAKTLDKKIYTLDWNSFLDFRTQASHPVFSLLKKGYCHALFADRPVEWQQTYCDNADGIFYAEEDVGFSEEDINRTKETLGISFTPDTTFVRVQVDFSRDDLFAKFRFMYNLSTQKVLWNEISM